MCEVSSGEEELYDETSLTPKKLMLSQIDLLAGSEVA